MRIREAVTADAEAITDLLGQLGYPQDDAGATARRIRSWAADPASAALVAEDDGEVLGVIAVHLCPSFERDGHWGRIAALVVAEHARRRGVAARLVATAEAFAAERGCLRMEVTSSDYRDDAHAFYKSLGFSDQAGRSSRFLRDLG